MNSIVLAVLAMSCCALAQRTVNPLVNTNGQVPIVEKNFDLNLDGSYRFNYASADGSNREETSVVTNPGTAVEARAVQGSYSYISPEGTPVTVNYVADENGYRTTGNVINNGVGRLNEVELTRQRQAALLGYPAGVLGNGYYASQAARLGGYYNPNVAQLGAYLTPEAARVAEAARLAEVARVAEAARLAEAAKLSEKARAAETARLAEAARLSEAARLAQAARLAGVAPGLLPANYQARYLSNYPGALNYNGYYNPGVAPYYRPRAY